MTRNAPTLTDLSNVLVALDTLLKRTKQRVQVCLMLFSSSKVTYFYLLSRRLRPVLILNYRGAKRPRVIDSQNMLKIYCIFFYLEVQLLFRRTLFCCKCWTMLPMLNDKGNYNRLGNVHRKINTNCILHHTLNRFNDSVLVTLYCRVWFAKLRWKL